MGNTDTSITDSKGSCSAMDSQGQLIEEHSKNLPGRVLFRAQLLNDGDGGGNSGTGGGY